MILKKEEDKKVFKGAVRSRKIFASFIIFCMILTLLPIEAFAAQASDIRNHWAKPQIESWMDRKLVSGYPDGTFRPDNNITRAEFMALVNGAFDYAETAQINYSDVKGEDWYANVIAKAKAAGYIGGYPDGTMRPNNPISREEAAAVIMKLKNLEGDEVVANKFSDANQMSWSKGSIGAVASTGIMGGYPDGTFKPHNPLKRAEAVVTLDKALAKEEVKTTVYDKAGTYGEKDSTTTIVGDVSITSAGTTLQNMVINGNLTIEESVGEGDVYLKSVVVKGDTIVKGGGANSIHFENSILVNVIVNKADGSIRIVVSGSTSVQEVTLQSGAKLEESNLTGLGFETVAITEALPKDSIVTLLGTFETVEVSAATIMVEIPEGTIANLVIDETAEDTTIDVSAESKIIKAIIDAIVQVVGEGTVEEAQINTSGVTFENAPEQSTGTQEPTVKPPVSSGGGGGSGDSTGTTAVSVSAISINQQNQTLAIGQTLALSLTFNPTNATNKNVTWTSDKSNVATVSSNGLVTAVAEGIATITATTADGGKTDTIEITVGAPWVVLNDFIDTEQGVTIQGYVENPASGYNQVQVTLNEETTSFFVDDAGAFSIALKLADGVNFITVSYNYDGKSTGASAYRLFNTFHVSSKPLYDESTHKYSGDLQLYVTNDDQIEADFSSLTTIYGELYLIDKYNDRLVEPIDLQFSLDRDRYVATTQGIDFTLGDVYFVKYYSDASKNTLIGLGEFGVRPTAVLRDFDHTVTEANLTLNGYLAFAEQGFDSLKVFVNGGAGIDITGVDVNGNFSVDVTLQPGENSIELRFAYDYGNMGGTSGRGTTVEFIGAPVGAPQVFFDNYINTTQGLTIQGHVENVVSGYNQVQVTLNEETTSFSLDDAGAFSIALELADGVNFITVSYNYDGKSTDTSTYRLFNTFYVSSKPLYDDATQKYSGDLQLYVANDDPINADFSSLTTIYGELYLIDKYNDRLQGPIDLEFTLDSNGEVYSAVTQGIDFMLDDAYFIKYYSDASKSTLIGLGNFRVRPTVALRGFNHTVTEANLTLDGYLAFAEQGYDSLKLFVNEDPGVEITGVDGNGNFRVNVPLQPGDNSIELKLQYNYANMSGTSGRGTTVKFVVTQVNAITITGENGVTEITENAGTLQMIATVQPEDATNETVTWSVVNISGEAAIDQNGLLTAIADGTVKVIATANDGSNVAGELIVNISGQVEEPVAMAVTSDAPEFTVGVQEEFTVTTQANDDAGKMVRAYFTVPSEVTSLEYQEQNPTHPSVGQWFPLTDVYGPDGGFPIMDATSNFRATVNTAGTYTVKVEFRAVEDSSVIGSHDIVIVVAEAVAEPVAMTVTSDAPEFTVGVQEEFTVTTQANDDAGKMVRAYFTVPSEVTSLEYQEQNPTHPSVGQWFPLTDVYGPEGGFPVMDATSNFRATVNTAGTYTVKVEFRAVEDSSVIGSHDIVITVAEAVE
jgi:uncharacterized protein YjdB